MLCMSGVHSFLFLSSIPLYGNSVIYSSVDGHLGFLKFGAIMNKAAVYVCIDMFSFCQILKRFDRFLKMKLLLLY